LAQVTPTGGDPQTPICLDGSFSILNDIVVSEGSNSDFSPTSTTGLTFILTAPGDFKFDTSAGSVAVTSGGRIDAISMAISADSSTITITIDLGGGGGDLVDGSDVLVGLLQGHLVLQGLDGERRCADRARCGVGGYPGLALRTPGQVRLELDAALGARGGT